MHAHVGRSLRTCTVLIKSRKKFYSTHLVCRHVANGVSDERAGGRTSSRDEVCAIRCLGRRGGPSSSLRCRGGADIAEDLSCHGRSAACPFPVVFFLLCMLAKTHTLHITENTGVFAPATTCAAAEFSEFFLLYCFCSPFFLLTKSYYIGPFL